MKSKTTLQEAGIETRERLFCSVHMLPVNALVVIFHPKSSVNSETSKKEAQPNNQEGSNGVTWDLTERQNLGESLHRVVCKLLYTVLPSLNNKCKALFKKNFFGNFYQHLTLKNKSVNILCDVQHIHLFHKTRTSLSEIEWHSSLTLKISKSLLLGSGFHAISH